MIELLNLSAKGRFAIAFSTTSLSVFDVTVLNHNESKIFTNVKNAAPDLEAL
jgi:hypothetical protein